MKLFGNIFTVSRTWRLFWLCSLIPIAIAYFGYRNTVVDYTYPGAVTKYAAEALEASDMSDLSYPVFKTAARYYAKLIKSDDSEGPVQPAELNKLPMYCGVAAAGLFFMLVVRLILSLAAENIGGELHVFVPIDVDDDDDDDSRSSSPSSDGTKAEETPVPMAVLIHNNQSLIASIIGAVAAATAFSFAPPVWHAATRLLPYAFDIAVLLLILNLYVDYRHSGLDIPYFLCVFISAAMAFESPVFLLLFPVAVVILFKTMAYNELVNSARATSTVTVALGGLLFSAWTILQCSQLLPVPITDYVVLATKTFQIMKEETSGWMIHYGWSYSFLLVILPFWIIYKIATDSFSKRTIKLFLLQLLALALLAPPLLFKSFTLRRQGWEWEAFFDVDRIAPAAYLLIAAEIGILIAAWCLMIESFLQRRINPDDPEDVPDFYEHRDNRLVVVLGSIGAWVLLAGVMLLPLVKSPARDEIKNPQAGRIAQQLVKEISSGLTDGDCLINLYNNRHEILLHGFEHRQRFHELELSTERWQYILTPKLREWVNSDPGFGNLRVRLLNMLDVSNNAFLMTWLNRDPEAYRHLAFFADPSRLNLKRWQPVPCGYVIRLAPAEEKLDVDQLLARHMEITDATGKLLADRWSEHDGEFDKLRTEAGRQLAFVGNMLGCLLAANGKNQEALQLFQRMAGFDRKNLAVLFNQYQLARTNKAGADEISALEARLKEIPLEHNVFELTVPVINHRYGALLNQDVLSLVRRNLWVKGMTIRKMLTNVPVRTGNPLAALNDKVEELHQLVTKYLDANDYEHADDILDILFDLNEKDTFVMVSKARIGLQEGNPAEAGLWLDLAKENGYPAAALYWEDAELLSLSGKHEEAKARINYLIPDHHDNIYLWGSLTKILLKENNYFELEDRVLPAVQYAASLHDHYLYYWLRGMLAERQRAPGVARMYYLKTLEMNPTLSDLRERLLALDDELNVPAFTRSDAIASLRINPEHPYANYLFGKTRANAMEWALARDLLEDSLKHEHRAAALAWLGYVLLNQGEIEPAGKALKEALALDSTQLFTHQALANWYLAAKQPKSADLEIRYVMSKSTPTDDMRLTLVEAMIDQGQLEEAASELSEMESRSDELQPLELARLDKLRNRTLKALGIDDLNQKK